MSLTEFTAKHATDIPRIVRSGLRLRQGWYGMPGAVGIYLWADLSRQRSGSLTVWTNEKDLRRWVGVPVHVAIMRRYRTRGSVQSAKWFPSAFDRTEILTEARRRLAVGDFS